MAKIKKVQISETEHQYQFMCPGCGHEHAFNSTWKFNDDYDLPTLSPSVLVRWGDKPASKRCHSFIKEGNIQFLGDCTHKLAGQTVPLLEII